MSTILDTIGNSPLIRLNRLVESADSEIYLKMERTNPGGSIKDRPALYIIEEAERRGWLKPGGTLIESSSGNFGISLAMIGAAKGYRVIVLVDPKTTPVNLAMMKAYGAEVIVVTEQDDSGSYHKTRIALANKLHREIPGSFRPDQCFNPWNGDAHYVQTAKELMDQSGHRIDAVIVTVSTGGQIGGLSRYIKEYAPHVKVIAVDAVGSTIFGGKAHAYLLPGMGLSWTPTNVDDLQRIDEVYKVPDEDAFLMCRVLAKHEGILGGGSTGAGMVAAWKLAQLMGRGKRIVCVASDNGERYLPTIYNDDWLQERGILTDIGLQEMKIRVRELPPYSRNPAETANYKPELAEQLDSPSRLISRELFRHG
ncbi:PLP-dependent cysteine synthase family protein [Paenibacillus sp. RC84]|uniref:PLP-dependent cysteine synthase family protein n=1 Tax=Paenibacillus sp. RC84 TaxID=3156252 RepID=UPI0035121A5A